PQVSAICLGTAYFGTRIDRSTAFEMMDTYYEQGGRFIDTANNYAGWMPEGLGGDAERTIGAWMQSRGVRQEIFIASKVGFNYRSVPQGTSSERIREECEKSLRNLGVERIDLYYTHLDDRTTPQEETLRTLDELVRVGKVGLIGASNHAAWRMEGAYQICKSEGLAQYVALQNHHSYLQPRPEVDWGDNVVMDNEHFDFARSRDVRLLAYYSLLKGTYAREDRPLWSSYDTQDNRQRLERLKVVADDLGITLPQVVLAWMLNRDPAVLPITTASQKAHLLENLGAVEVEIAPEQMDFLNFTDIVTR
ncbi:MAG: aldo/keto reductase, partial [Anaerolineaceae bacterium]|nr:aldo/keto reductase [Anaerolineaceae bacterium]